MTLRVGLHVGDQLPATAGARPAHAGVRRDGGLSRGMPIYVKTCSFGTTQHFDSRKDDPAINSALDQLQRGGARIQEIVLRMAGNDNYVVATYMIVYEAPSALS